MTTRHPTRDSVIRAVNNILQQAEPPEPNITKEMRDALKRLKEDESITVLPADKGRASAVMDTDTYHTKMSTLIENGPYQLVNGIVRCKYAVDPAKQDGVVYRIPFECGEVHIGKTGRPMQDIGSLRSMTETSYSPLPRPPPF